ncbi:MAG: pyridoxamine 5'-phosphate oxidase family protein [Ruminococcus sp.]|nr:pyridoxamine 5'-phosphate oxidase family protein [Ruminococcus sp.]
MLTKSEIFNLMKENPVFHLATMDGDQPRVRGMLLFRADENGIIFHTASTKDVFEQIMKNPKVELCFQGQGTQIRVTGKLQYIENDENLREEIFSHPTRKFLQAWKDNGIDNLLQIFCLKNGVATEWTMETNFDEKQFVKL